MSAAFQFPVAVTAESAARWLMAREDRIVASPTVGDDVPVSYLMFLRAQPVLGQSVHTLLDRDPDRGVYGGVSYCMDRAPRVGERLRGVAEVTDRKTVDGPRGTLQITTLTVRYTVGSSDPFISETVRMIDLPARPVTGHPPYRAKHRAAGTHIADLPAVSHRQAAWMAAATGDMNRLHFDPDYATGRGFKNIVVPAPLLTALVERAVTAHLGSAPERLDLRFHAPTYPGDPLELWAESTDDGLHLEVVSSSALRVEGRAVPADGGQA